MAEPESILAHLTSLFHSQGQTDLRGKRLLISTGGTREHLDPVRFIGNPATGKMGIALAQAAAHRGALVTLVHGPLLSPSVPLPATVTTIPVVTATEMHQALLEHLSLADWVIMAAAVADVRPAHYAPDKLPKAALPAQLDLVPVPDIVADLATRKQPHQRLIGFAAQTGDILPPAREKLARKHLDAIVANPIDQLHSGFGSDHNQAILLDTTGREQAIPACSKLELAHHILDFVLTLGTN